MDWFLLAICCAFFLASADALTKRYLADYTAPELVLIRLGLTGLILSPHLLFDPLPPVPAVFWAWMAVLMPLEILAMLLYMSAIRDSPLALTLPYLAFTPVLTSVTSFLLLGERVSWRGFAGILLVVAGTYLLNLERPQGNGRWAWSAPFRAIAKERGSLLMLAVAAIYSLTSVMGKEVLRYVPASAFGPFYSTLLGAVTLLVFSVRQPGLVRVLWRRPSLNVLVAAAMAAMVVTHFMAMARVEVAYMLSVKRTSLLFGMLYGALWFQERKIRQHLLSGAIMVAGVALIAL